MKNANRTLRKTSVLIAAGVGAAVGLSNPPAHAVTGADGNDISFGGSATELSGKVTLMYGKTYTVNVLIQHGGNATSVAKNAGNFLRTYSAGVACNTGSFYLGAIIAPGSAGGPAKYIKIRFNDGVQKFGWSQYQKVGTVLHFGAWGYNNTGGAIKTLGESVTAHVVPLANGKNKLFWTNANEDGIARYEAQTQDASSAWTTVGSEAAGAGSYAATVPAASNCRIVVEKVDGSTEAIGF
jgi:hypothetical protein